MSRTALLTDAQWAKIEPLLPSSDGKPGKPFRPHRPLVEGIIYRYRTGIAWRDVPAEFGPYQTVWKRHRRFAGDGTWDKVLAVLLTQADHDGGVDWTGFVFAMIFSALAYFYCAAAVIIAMAAFSVGGLHDQPGPSARHEPAPAGYRYRGLCRMTRNLRWGCSKSPTTMRSAGPAAG